MKYIPRLPQSNPNVSHEHPLREFFALLAAATILFFLLMFFAGLLVDTAVNYIDPETEARLFNSVEDGAEGDSEPKSEREQALQQLLDRIGECVDVGYPVDIEISPSGDVNAFAVPGGHIVVLDGLTKAVSSENGLAFVLGHELGHFKNRDHLRGMGRSMVALAASVLLTGANSNLSSVLTPVSYAEMAQHSQDREGAADAVGLEALQCLYGHVGGASELFRHLAGEEETDEWSIAHYFSSHPEAEARIAALKELADRQGYQSDDAARVTCEVCSE